MLAPLTDSAMPDDPPAPEPSDPAGSTAGGSSDPLAGGRRLSSRTVHRGRVVELAIERVRMPNGSEMEFELVHHRGAAAAVPVLSGPGGDEVLLVRQYRYATGGWLLEVPAGGLDRGELPADCARREVEEETGHRPAEVEPLGWVWSTPGFCDEKIWLFLARGLEPTRQRLEADEVLEVERLPLAEAVGRAVAGELHDAKTVAALLRAGTRLGIL
jgi:ADP-ribose pyrophosphatase